MNEEIGQHETTQGADVAPDAASGDGAASNMFGAQESTGARVGEDPLNPERDDKVNRMGTGSIPMLILEFAIPSVIGMLVNGAYNIIDSVFLGQSIGYIGQATMTAANPIMVIFMGISMFIGAGGNALAALRLGQGDRIGAERSLGNTVTLSIVVSAIVAVLAFSPAINGLLTISSATPETWDATKMFIQIISAGYFLQCIGLGVNNFIRTAGAPMRALLTMVIGAVTCIAANYLLVMVMGLGVMGSAISTVIGWLASAVTVLWYFVFTKNVPLKLHFRYMPIEFKTLRMILGLGLASFVMQVGAAIFSLVFNHQLVVYGSIHPLGADAALASLGVTGRVAMFSVFPLIGVAVAVQPLLGYNYGAHLYDRVKRTLLYGCIGATILAVTMWALVHIFPSQIVELFGITDPGLHDFTTFALRMQLMLIPLVGFQIVGSNYFQATGQPGKSIFLSLTRQILFLVPLMYILPVAVPTLFPELTGLDGLVFAMPVADGLAVFTTVIFIVLEMKRIKRLESGELQVREF